MNSIDRVFANVQHQIISFSCMANDYLLTNTFELVKNAMELVNWFFSPVFTVDLKGYSIQKEYKKMQDLPLAGGANGARFVLDKDGKKIGVFKPENLVPSLDQRIILVIKNLFGQVSFLRQDSLRSSKTELLANAFDEFLDLPFTPGKSYLCQMGDVVGLYQQFVSGVEAKGSDWLEKEVYEEAEVEIFQRFVVFDFLLGNFDRHLENWLVRVGNGTLVGITAIDNEKSFPVANPLWIPFTNQYAWSRLSIAERPLTENIKTWVRDIAQCDVDSFVNKVEENPNLKGFVTKEMQSLLQKRFDLLAKVCLKTGFSPKDFANYRL